MSLTYSIELLGVENPENPENPENFTPPSVTESKWFADFDAATQDKEVAGTITSTTLKFDSYDEYTAWIERYKLTDATLIDDFRVWNTAHGFSYKYELRTNDGTMLTPLKIIPLD